MAETVETSNSISGILQNPVRRQLFLILGVAGIAALMAFIWMWGQEPDYRVLFSSFTDRDGGSIVTELQKMNIPYKYADGGGAILVPANRVYDVRFKLAAQGLPKGGNVGFELMTNQKMGTSQFLEQINFQRALEGELARSIETIAAIQGVRVHLALPKPSVFARDQQKPTASVLINLLPGRNLDNTQVNAIVHLVASSVPELPPKAVTVVDQNGNLLSEASSIRGNGEPNPMQLKYIQSLQQDTVKRIESILTPIVGVSNVRAEATVEVDFSESEQAAESYKPNKPPETATLRSQQTSESQGPATPATGVPGALSNQPPNSQSNTPPNNQPNNQNNQQTALVNNQPNANTAASAQVVQGTSRKESTTNYEVDKTVRHVQQPMGAIKRLTVAVVINYRRSGSKPNDEPKPLTEQETNQISNLVKEAMGYNQARGDSLSIVNSPFLMPPQEVIPELPFWKQSENMQMAREMGRYALIGLVLLFLYFRGIKPLLNKLNPPPIPSLEQISEDVHEGASSLPKSSHEQIEEEGNDEYKQYQKKVVSVKKLATQDPKLVATVLQAWLATQKKEE